MCKRKTQLDQIYSIHITMLQTLQKNTKANTKIEKQAKYMKNRT